MDYNSRRVVGITVSALYCVLSESVYGPISLTSTVDVYSRITGLCSAEVKPSDNELVGTWFASWYLFQSSLGL